MKILLLGYGKEGQAMEKYLRAHFDGAEIEVWSDFDRAEIANRDYSLYDIIFRSPSVPPLGLERESSVTKYFFEHSPCPIIGVTATKGKGTTCSFIKSLLDALGEDAYLVGNIGVPAVEVLDKLTADSVVVYEMSSFQLWDLKKSPHVAVVGHLEPDHLNVHRDYAEYLAAKADITRFQSAEDYLVYYDKNPETVKIAEESKARKIPYPFELPTEIEAAVKLPGRHNIYNAMAAIAAVACYKDISPDEYLAKYSTEIIAGLANFKGLPHRLEFVREVDGVKYFDDSFSTNPSSLRVAAASFVDDNLTIIVGGRDKTDYEDLPEIYEILQAPQVKNIVLIGESGRKMAQEYQDERFLVADSLKEAVKIAQQKTDKGVVVLSPAAASFDMFESAYDRGDKFQELVRQL